MCSIAISIHDCRNSQTGEIFNNISSHCGGKIIIQALDIDSREIPNRSVQFGKSAIFGGA